MSFTFTRNPSVKVSVDVVQSGLVQAQNQLVIVGHVSSGGGTVTAMNVPVVIENFGDAVAAQAEAEGYFGAGSEAAQMVVAAIKGAKPGGVFPPIKVIPIANGDTASNLAATLAANIGLPMPFVVVPYALEISAAAAALKAHLTAISASDRGDNSQFGSFGFMATLNSLSTASTAAQSAGSQVICAPWLRDAGAIQPVFVVAAAYAAVCAANGVPFLPLNGVVVGGLQAPAAVSDWHTTGDAGTVSLGLDAGLAPLTILSDGLVHISRSITTYRDTVNNLEVGAYYDMQDWQVLYYYRQNAYTTAVQPRYAIAKATDQKIKALLSELIKLAKDFESLEMFQYVDKLVQYFTATRVPGNRFAAVYEIPVNVVPGFMNKGIAAHGVETFDSVTLS